LDGWKGEGKRFGSAARNVNLCNNELMTTNKQTNRGANSEEEYSANKPRLLCSLGFFFF
jgi:hypothetical protein